MRFSVPPAAAMAVAITLAGCASLPRDRGYVEAGELIEARRGVAPTWAADAVSPAVPEIPSEPVTADQAVRLAFLYNPRIREEYARLGLGRAELEEARRIANPTFGYAKLDARSGGAQITRSLSVSFADLLLLPARKRFAADEIERLQNAVAAKLLELASEVEVAWFESVSASQVAAMRDLVARAAEGSAELAQRFFDAGNINRLQLEQEWAAASQARIAAVRGTAGALRARSELAGLIGLRIDAAWRTAEQLPAPPSTGFSDEALLPLALEQRLDLAAAQQEVALREQVLGTARRWRWLGAIEVGYERESEVDGGVLRGPTLALGLPIFNQGQAAIARTQAELMDARARRDALLLAVHNEGRLGVERLAVARDIVERYRTALVPRREAIVARTQEQVNFMLMGIFELILAKQQEYDAYQEYLEAVRDYWTARAELRRVVGGRLPDDGAVLEPTIGVDAILPSQDAPAMDHSMHDMSGAAPASAPEAQTDDPHAGHRMPMPEPTETVAPDEANPDPHAGHRMPAPAAAESDDESAEPTDDEDHDHGDTP